MNTFIRLLVLIPATIFVTLTALLGIGFAGPNFLSFLAAFAIVAVPAGLIVWTIRDHFKRKALKDTKVPPL
ncbi:MAG: hypothetical protein H6915_05510 [Novosphingobium sp.]|nr:hypothetical protein [Novosphingobium sp.]MCP5389204.1 hypothetical protein [Novosphingobium sp.]